MCEKISRRGVYYDLSLSPYSFTNGYGDIFKFSSEKKLEIYTRDVPKEVERLHKLIERHNLKNFIPEEIVVILERGIYNSFHSKIEKL